MGNNDDTNAAFANDENISEDEMGEEKSSKIYNYDSSYFSKKMAEVDKKGGANSHLGFTKSNYINSHQDEMIGP